VCCKSFRGDGQTYLEQFKNTVATGKYRGLPADGTHLGLRREAKRHAAFAGTKDILFAGNLRPPESGVAAPALPPQSKTLSRGSVTA
jgi:hypothetical protein